MGNMLTTVTSNWFEVQNINIALALIKLNNIEIRDEDTHMDYWIDQEVNKIRISMHDNVNWDKYLNHHSIFDLFSMILAPGASMIVDEIGYMDGTVAYQHQHQISPSPLFSKKTDIHQKLISNSWETVAETIEYIQNQATNLHQLCTIIGLPFPFINGLHYDMETEEILDILTNIFHLEQAPYRDAVVLFIVHQLITRSMKDCGDIDNPARTKDGASTVLWAMEDPSESFCEGWDGLEEITKEVFRLSHEKGIFLKYLFEMVNPTIRPVYTIDLSGIGLTGIPHEILALEDVEETVLDLRENQLQDITDEQLERIVRFEEFHLEGNPIPDERYREIQEKIKGLLD